MLILFLAILSLSTKVMADDRASRKIEQVNPLLTLVIENNRALPFANVMVDSSEREQLIRINNQSPRSHKVRVNLITKKRISRIAPQIIAPGHSALFVGKIDREQKDVAVTVEVSR